MPCSIRNIFQPLNKTALLGTVSIETGVRKIRFIRLNNKKKTKRRLHNRKNRKQDDYEDALPEGSAGLPSAHCPVKFERASLLFYGDMRTDQRLIHCLSPCNPCSAVPASRINACRSIEIFDVLSGMIEFLLAAPAGIFTYMNSTTACSSQNGAWRWHTQPSNRSNEHEH